MKKRKRSGTRGQDLRAKAEERLTALGRAAAGEAKQDPAERLIAELDVHKVELEIQNEELRTARLALETTLTRYTELFDFAPLGYAVLRMDGTIIEINHAGAALLGYERSRLLGKRFEAFVQLSHQPSVLQLLGRTRQSGTKQSGDVDLVDGQGGVVSVGLTAAQLSGPDPSLLLGFEDIRERRARENRLRQTELALREADSRKDEFLAALSHELRNPLTPIRTSLLLLEEKAAGDQVIRRVQTIMDRQVTQLSHLVDDLLDVTRINRGKVHLRREKLDLALLVRATLDDHRDSLTAAGIRLETHLGGGPFGVEGDAARIVQSISNALGNSEKYTPPGGSVTLTLQRSGGEVCLRIRDTGAGIAPDMLERVFEPFAQAPQGLDRSPGGLGLGLAVVKGLIELHGGRTTITSGGPGCGTELAIVLPRIELPLDETAADVPQESTEAAEHHRRRVLIIDDIVDTADTLAEALEGRGHEVRVAYQGQPALEIARAFRPDVVICDIGLPGGMSGYAVAQTFRGEHVLNGAYLIALTGYGTAADIARAREAGFDEHLTKPPRMKDLVRLISRAPAVQMDTSSTSTIGPA